MKESSDGETLMAVGIWFQISGAAEEKARRPEGATEIAGQENAGLENDGQKCRAGKCRTGK